MEADFRIMDELADNTRAEKTESVMKRAAPMPVREYSVERWSVREGVIAAGYTTNDGVLSFYGPSGQVDIAYAPHAWYSVVAVDK